MGIAVRVARDANIPFWMNYQFEQADIANSLHWLRAEPSDGAQAQSLTREVLVADRLIIPSSDSDHYLLAETDSPTQVARLATADLPVIRPAQVQCRGIAVLQER